ncbi:peroxide stress protein YaaA [Catenovulum sp. SX2]|uniref:peroxide stress protein YaaA n=1 Tax=Catenovulum sp. SX2 TaxID=3398614 RepID=UPI003F82707D
MIIVISPAKNLDYETATPTQQYTQPELLTDSTELADVCKNLTPLDLSNLMHISDKLAGLNAARFADWTNSFTLENAKQALFAFNGDVYTGLDAYTLKAEDIDYAQQHLRILSGLYGLLKPLDLIMPYRLEMGTKLANPRGSNLYHFWGSIITNKLNESAETIGSETLVNLASNEYFKSVKAKEFNGKIIAPDFKDWKNGQYKTISFFAKKARGMMARYIIENKIETVEGLLEFTQAGYQYNPDLSTDIKPVFTRQEQ